MPNIKLTVGTVSAPCAGGKTFAIIQDCYSRTNEGDKLLIVQPSLQLIEQTIKQKSEPIILRMVLRKALFHELRSISKIPETLAKFFSLHTLHSNGCPT